jgi:FKBP-type peptidyl-prolyl cis-trans isomerase SlyD
MSTNEASKQIADDLVVNMAYILTVDGELVDATEEGESLVFIQGYSSIIPGLEQALYGMTEGERRMITVPAKEAYGEYDLDQIIPIPLSEFPDDFHLEPDLELEMKDKDGDLVYARIVSVGKTRVKMDFNHPLAGKDLDFEVTILELRPASAKELEQGYVA